MHRGKLILWGCGDFINDYEGMARLERYRSDLGLMYLASVEPESGRLVQLELVPTQLRHFQGAAHCEAGRQVDVRCAASRKQRLWRERQNPAGWPHRDHRHAPRERALHAQGAATRSGVFSVFALVTFTGTSVLVCVVMALPRAGKGESVVCCSLRDRTLIVLRALRFSALI